MAEIHDTGGIPLDRPDAKLSAAIDPATGQVWAVALDLAAKRYALWQQARGWVAQREPYGAIDLTSWQLVIHDNAAKLVAATWRDTSPDGAAHLVVLVLRPTT